MSSRRKKLLVATFNQGKAGEIRAFFASLPIEILSLSSIREVTPSPEDGATFEANARQKAVFYSRRCDALTMADDSGLIVDVLGGEPGVHSARYLSDSATDEERYRAILEKLREVPRAGRTARFECCIALARQGEVLEIFTGTVEGLISQEARGSNGFGFDPIFLIPELGQTLAELPSEKKLSLSHRGRALEQLGVALAQMKWM